MTVTDKADLSLGVGAQDGEQEVHAASLSAGGRQDGAVRYTLVGERAHVTVGQ